jgi:hypothetical protein
MANDDFDEQLGALATKVANQRTAILTEEATKNAFVMPFISTVLGYDVFNPLEVVPEFTADVGVKRGEKVDYAIMADSEVQILIECKKSSEPLRIEHAGQLFRYFSTTNARIAILTNGQVYEFYTDLDAPNKMDAKPFLVLDLLDIDPTLLPELRKLAKDNFNLDSVLSAAGELKYIGSIKRAIAAEFRDPEDEWIRFFISRSYDGTITQRIREQFRPLVVKAMNQFLSEQVNDRLKTALGSSVAPPPVLPSETAPPTNASAGPVHEDLARDTEVVTTEEELEGYHIVKAIACAEVTPARITHRDAKSYFAIMVDDNNRKSIARLYFNAKSKKYLGVFDSEKVETRHLIESLDDIYKHSEAIRGSAKAYSG